MSWLARPGGVERPYGDGWHAEVTGVRAGTHARIQHDDGRVIERVFAPPDALTRWFEETHAALVRGDPETLALVVQGLPRLARVTSPTGRTHCCTPAKHLPGAKTPQCASLTRCNAGAGGARAPA